VAVNWAALCPEVTTTLAGTVRIELLVPSGTLNPLVPALVFKDTVQVEVPGV
jgi:hypothetical protein